LALQDLIRNLKSQREQAVIERIVMTSRPRSIAPSRKRREEGSRLAETTKDGEELAPNTRQFYVDLGRQHEATAIAMRPT
jgi:hypothetical protein